ncbi:uncharacterized protein ISCGN_006265 [Ixodes scapularis]
MEPFPYFYVYDFEAILEAENMSQSYEKHVPSSFCIVVIRSTDSRIVEQFLYRGEDCVEKFISILNQLSKLIGEWIRSEEVPMVSVDEEAHASASHCAICGESFGSRKRKVRDHDYFSGSYRKWTLDTYERDPLHYVSLPALSLACALNQTGVKLELLDDLDAYLFIEAGLLGGIGQCAIRNTRANVPGTACFDPDTEVSHILDLDRTADTDSFILQVTDPDVGSKLATLAETHLDTSGHPADHPLFSPANKMELGVFKNELPKDHILGFVWLKPKLYSMELASREHYVRTKGVKRCEFRKLTYELYVQTLEQQTLHKITQRTIARKLCENKSVVVEKIELNSFDNKRFIDSDGVSTLPFGH